MVSVRKFGLWVCGKLPELVVPKSTPTLSLFWGVLGDRSTRGIVFAALLDGVEGALSRPPFEAGDLVLLGVFELLISATYSVPSDRPGGRARFAGILPN